MRDEMWTFVVRDDGKGPGGTSDLWFVHNDLNGNVAVSPPLGTAGWQHLGPRDRRDGETEADMVMRLANPTLRIMTHALQYKLGLWSL